MTLAACLALYGLLVAVGSPALLAALVALTDRTGPQAAPGVLGAARTAVLDRADRLVEPASRTDPVRARRVLAADLASLVLGPALALVTMGLTVCPLAFGCPCASARFAPVP